MPFSGSCIYNITEGVIPGYPPYAIVFGEGGPHIYPHLHPRLRNYHLKTAYYLSILKKLVPFFFLNLTFVHQLV